MLQAHVVVPGGPTHLLAEHASRLSSVLELQVCSMAQSVGVPLGIELLTCFGTRANAAAISSSGRSLPQEEAAPPVLKRAAVARKVQGCELALPSAMTGGYPLAYRAVARCAVGAAAHHLQALHWLAIGALKRCSPCIVRCARTW